MSEYYVPSPTVYIFMIYAVIFVPSVLLLDNWALTCGRYIKRRNMSGKCLFLSLKGLIPI